jgi:AAA+ superfamily predicted ATPase
MGGPDVIRSLREALSHSPENVPLRKHLGDMLLGMGRAEEAEKEYRRALALEPENDGLKLALAEAFFEEGKNSEAIVVVEELIRKPSAAAAAYVLHARLCLRAGEPDRAARQYRRALELDPEAADAELSARLGVGPRRAEEADVVDGRVRAAADPGEEGGGPQVVELERPKTTFADVGGMEPLKDEIRLKIIHPLTHPEVYKAYGKPIGGGILMYGPPGCGKTHLARATAGEVKASFIPVGINDVLEMWIGSSERNLHAFFEHARRHTPCVLFFDEVDALGAKRVDMRQSAGRQTINQFLAELDGVEAFNEGVLVLAATNAPWHLDSAFRRPGRFDRILFVPPPDEPARAAILRILLKGKPVESIDHEHAAAMTKEFSGADLKAVVDVAVERKLKDALKDGVPRPLTTKDLVEAARSVKPSTRDWFSTARNYALYANQGGLYDDILKHLKL